MIKAISFMGEKKEKPYNGILKGKEPGSTFNVGRNIYTARDAKYAQENNIKVINSGRNIVVNGEPSWKNVKDNLKSIFNAIGSALKKVIKTHK